MKKRSVNGVPVKSFVFLVYTLYIVKSGRIMAFLDPREKKES